ncbi:hypothetical protein [Variovorax sp. KK3]|uniref:hypothetical protein n=1 Tax=Variovorax sp. KK3 TaxID=1855728 RepID=UPI00117FC501|nr:hypothetical protein [Variovorax sp. KK3]
MAKLNLFAFAGRAAPVGTRVDAGTLPSAFVKTLLAGLLACYAAWVSAANLPSGQGLAPGQGIYSDNGQYLLVMQGDGNLVHYRVSDGAVRWHSNTAGSPGSILAMQGDGNAVTYFTPPHVPPTKGGGYAKPQGLRTYPTWYSATAGNPGAYMRSQDDGNLVVVAADGRALWGTGPDPDLNKPDPKNPGDVVGRELVSSNGIVQSLGHIAFSDGLNLYEVMNEPLVVQYTSLSSFKKKVAAQGPQAYWGTASPSIPFFYLLGCYETNCSEGARNQVLSSREAMVARARQIYQLGSFYTLSDKSVPSLPKRDSYPLRVGTYRCDTFVLDIYDLYGSVYTDATGKYVSIAPAVDRWINFRDTVLKVKVLPTIAFQLLKNFRG